MNEFETKERKQISTTEDFIHDQSFDDDSSDETLSSNEDLEDNVQDDHEIEDSESECDAHKKQKPSRSLKSGYPSHQCDVCLETFATKSSLKSHLKTHSHEEGKIYQCDYCSKQFLTKGNFQVHINLITVEKNNRISELGSQDGDLQSESLFECAECRARFESYCLFKKHNLQAGHNRKRQHKCKICSKCFVRPSELENHERVHSGDKPFLCHVCSKSFSVRGNLQRHLKNHIEDPLYSCELCPKRFTSESQLKRHSKLHQSRPFMCSVCFSCYDTEEKFNRHLKNANRSHRAKSDYYLSSGYKKKKLLNLYK